MKSCCQPYPKPCIFFIFAKKKKKLNMSKSVKKDLFSLLNQSLVLRTVKMQEKSREKADQSLTLFSLIHCLKHSFLDFIPWWIRTRMNSGIQDILISWRSWSSPMGRSFSISRGEGQRKPLDCKRVAPRLTD